MRRASRIRKVATLLSSLTLGCALLVYADWRAPARSSGSAGPDADSEFWAPEEDAEDVRVMPGTKSAIGLGGGAGGPSRRGAKRTAPAGVPADERKTLRGTESLPAPSPPRGSK